MRKIAEIRKDLNDKIAEVKAFDNVTAEAMDKATEELRALTAELNLANESEAAEQRAAEKKIENLSKKEGRSFSFTKFLREVASGNLTGIEAEVAEMGREENKRLGLPTQGIVIPSCVLRSATGQNAGTATDGGNLIKTEAPVMLEELKKNLVVAQLGATVLSNLTGQVPVITSAQISAGWKAEGAQGSASVASYAKATLTPHRIFVQTAVTKDLLVQESADVEADLVRKMSEAIANAIEGAAIAGTGSSNEPTGILGHASVPVVACGTNGAALTNAKIIELETKVNDNNGNKGSLAYLTNAKVWGAMKTMPIISGGTDHPVLDVRFGKIVNGYPAEFSSFVPSNYTKGTGSSAGSNLSGMIFGNFRDLFIGMWGGIDVIVDPYTRAAYGEILLTVNTYADTLVAEPKSFAIIKDIVA